MAFLDTVDTILLGRKTYELFVDYWPTATKDEEIIADRLNELPKLVVSNTLSEAPGGVGPSRDRPWRPSGRGRAAEGPRRGGHGALGVCRWRRPPSGPT